MIACGVVLLIIVGVVVGVVAGGAKSTDEAMDLASAFLDEAQTELEGIMNDDDVSHSSSEAPQTSSGS